jgi:hypothetical protein
VSSYPDATAEAGRVANFFPRPDVDVASDLRAVVTRNRKRSSREDDAKQQPHSQPSYTAEKTGHESLPEATARSAEECSARELWHTQVIPQDCFENFGKESTGAVQLEKGSYQGIASAMPTKAQGRAALAAGVYEGPAVYNNLLLARSILL